MSKINTAVMQNAVSFHISILHRKTMAVCVIWSLNYGHCAQEEVEPGDGARVLQIGL